VQVLRVNDKLPFEKQALWDLAQLEAGSYARHRVFLWGLFARPTCIATDTTEASTEATVAMTV